MALNFKHGLTQPSTTLTIPLLRLALVSHQLDPGWTLTVQELFKAIVGGSNGSSLAFSLRWSVRQLCATNCDYSILLATID